MDISTVGELIEALKAYPSDYPLEVGTGSDFGLQIVSIELARWKLLSGGKETEYRYLTDKGKAEDEGSEEKLLDVPPPHTWELETLPKVTLFV